MTTLKRPEDGSGPGYNPFTESIIRLFPTAVASAVDLVTPDRCPEFYAGLLECGATVEGLERAVQFYDRYFCDLMMNRAEPTPGAAFHAAGIESGDLSFMLFQSMVTACLMSAYHEAIVANSQLEALWCKSSIKDVQCVMAARLPNICPNAVRLVEGLINPCKTNE